MTCAEFLKLLHDNPDKEIKFMRVYDSYSNGFCRAHGYTTLQWLGTATSEVKNDVVTITIGGDKNNL